MPELAVIVPTLNERENLPTLVQRLETALAGVDFEVLFVDDDSTDGTAALARQLAQVNPRVRAVHRIGRRGLSSAAVEGMLASSAPFLAVMDGDLQHDERILPALLEAVRDRGAELAVGTRNAEPGGMGAFARHRVALSSLGRALSAMVCRTELSDPMSGFFLLRRSLLDEVARDLSLTGFKILVDIVASAGRPLRLAEVPYTFGKRQHGESKLDTLVAVEYLLLLLHKLTAGVAPVHYLTYAFVGGLGVLANSALLQAMTAAGMPFGPAQALSGLGVIGLNFALNNRVTFRFNRLRKSERWMGFGIYAATCAVGLAVNVALAGALYRGGLGQLAAGAAGIVVGSVWNYWATSVFVWRVGRTEQARRHAAGSGSLPIETVPPSQALVDTAPSLGRLQQALQAAAGTPTSATASATVAPTPSHRDH